ncbi:MAG: threonylcarbamoyl-AMP synthase [Bacteroidetes bacterium GWA2_31_9]|nr:MAG: threonylcarbamoyl-AMP synthase [Bacteroidetes bacterium GWA2_31_9]
MDKSYLEEIKTVVKLLKEGKVILYPTDTIWGIGCDATNSEAVKRVYEIKKRIDSKAMIVLLDLPEKISLYIKQVPEIAWDIIDCADEPLTIIYPEAIRIAKNLIAEDGSVGIRITKEQFSKDLIYRFNKPIVSTSANISGEPSPACFADISDEIKNSVDYIVKYSQNFNQKSKPSGIIKVGLNGEVWVIRK